MNGLYVLPEQLRAYFEERRLSELARVLRECGGRVNFNARKVLRDAPVEELVLPVPTDRLLACESGRGRVFSHGEVARAVMPNCPNLRCAFPLELKFFKHPQMVLTECALLTMCLDDMLTKDSLNTAVSLLLNSEILYTMDIGDLCALMGTRVRVRGSTRRSVEFSVYACIMRHSRDAVDAIWGAIDIRLDEPSIVDEMSSFSSELRGHYGFTENAVSLFVLTATVRAVFLREPLADVLTHLRGMASLTGNANADVPARGIQYILGAGDERFTPNSAPVIRALYGNLYHKYNGDENKVLEVMEIFF